MTDSKQPEEDVDKVDTSNIINTPQPEESHNSAAEPPTAAPEAPVASATDLNTPDNNVIDLLNDADNDDDSDSDSSTSSDSVKQSQEQLADRMLQLLQLDGAQQNKRLVHTGTVHWYDDTKKCGFIRSDINSDDNVFVHSSAVVSGGTLCTGAVVEYLLHRSAGSDVWTAVHVTGLDGGDIVTPTYDDHVDGKRHNKRRKHHTVRPAQADKLTEVSDSIKIVNPAESPQVSCNTTDTAAETDAAHSAMSSSRKRVAVDTADTATISPTTPTAHSLKHDDDNDNFAQPVKIRRFAQQSPHALPSLSPAQSMPDISSAPALPALTTARSATDSATNHSIATLDGSALITAIRTPLPDSPHSTTQVSSVFDSPTLLPTLNNMSTLSIDRITTAGNGAKEDCDAGDELAIRKRKISNADSTTDSAQSPQMIVTSILSRKHANSTTDAAETDAGDQHSAEADTLTKRAKTAGSDNGGHSNVNLAELMHSLPHIDDSTKYISVSCSLCNKSFNHTSQLADHILSRRHQHLLEVERIGKDKLQCTLCNMTFTSLNDREKHLRGKPHANNVLRQQQYRPASDAGSDSIMSGAVKNKRGNDVHKGALHDSVGSGNDDYSQSMRRRKYTNVPGQQPTNGQHHNAHQFLHDIEYKRHEQMQQYGAPAHGLADDRMQQPYNSTMQYQSQQMHSQHWPPHSAQTYGQSYMHAPMMMQPQQQPYYPYMPAQPYHAAHMYETTPGGERTMAAAHQYSHSGSGHPSISGHSSPAPSNLSEYANSAYSYRSPPRDAGVVSPHR